MGYTDNNDAEPALTYHIIDTIEHQEAVPIDNSRVPLYPDYPGIMSDHDICDRVDNQGLDEVWIWAYQGYPETKLQGSESRMSGHFGDISNSPRFGDMPICNSTYLVYTYNYARGTAEAFENWGHQIEVELAHVDADIVRVDSKGQTTLDCWMSLEDAVVFTTHLMRHLNMIDSVQTRILQTA